jgi:hypothetical protein
MRKRISRRDVIKGSAALGLTAFAAPPKAAAPEPVAITPGLIEAARKEAKVILYSSMDLPVGEKLGKAFEAQYPGIAVQIERSGSERLFQRLDQEFERRCRRRQEDDGRNQDALRETVSGVIMHCASRGRHSGMRPLAQARNDDEILRRLH